MDFKIIDSGKALPAENMTKDLSLLQSLQVNPQAILHFYDWQVPSATYGHFSRPLDYLNPLALEKFGLQLAKRPTGGGVIFHQFDFAFSFLLPAVHPLFSLNTLANYAFVNALVAKAISAFSDAKITPTLVSEQAQTKASDLCKFCMSSLTVYDVIASGKKIAGAAQRRTKHGLLHQGSIALQVPPDEFLKELFLPSTAVGKAMKENTFPLLEPNATCEAIENAKRSLASLLLEGFKKRL